MIRTKNAWDKKDFDAAEVERFKSFYQSHTLKETQEHFGISVSTIYKRLEKFNIPRTKTETFDECLARIDKDELTTYYKEHTLQDTRIHFDINSKWLSKLIKYYDIGKQPKSLESLAKIISKEELEEYYLSHSCEETRKYFNEKYNIPHQYTINSLIAYYKIDKLNNSKKRIKEYLDSVEKTSLHEIAKALDLGYINVTHLVKQIDTGNKIVYTPAGSSYEDEIKAFLIHLGVNFIHQSRRILNNGCELDFYLPETNVGIEINGAYWHSSLFKEKQYHLDKSKVAAEQGIRLIHIWDYEWDDPESQRKIKELIAIAAKCYSNKLFARACDVKEISKLEAKNFIDAYHLQGYRSAKVNLGLYHKEKLVQVMTLDNTKYNKNLNSDNDWEIIRECSLANTVVVGGKSKLFKYFVKNYLPEKVFSYCDFNKFNGNSYLALGMEFIGYSGPDMKWLMPNGQVKNRNPKKNSELKEQAQAKLFGCGSLKYLYKRAD